MSRDVSATTDHFTERFGEEGEREDQVCSVRYNPGHSINATKGCNGCEMGSNGRAAAAAAAVLQCVHTLYTPGFNPFHTLRRVRRSSLS